MNEIILPYLSPVKFVELNKVQPAQYISKFMDDYVFEETVKDWQQKTKFKQVWGMDDSVRVQIKTNYSPCFFKVFRCDGSEVSSTPFTTMQQDYFRPDYYIRQVEIDLADYSPGDYYFQINCGLSKPWVSEPQEFSADPKNTLYIEYSNYERYGEVYFQAPYSPSIRLRAGLYYDTPGSKDTVYEDQPLNIEMVKSIPFDVYKFLLGGASGCPPWLIKKVNRIFGCSDLKIDGRYFTKFNSQWEINSPSKDYPMAGWGIDLRERYNTEASIFRDDVQQTGKTSMIAVIDSKGFGLDDNGGDFLEIENVN